MQQLTEFSVKNRCSAQSAVQVALRLAQLHVFLDLTHQMRTRTWELLNYVFLCSLCPYKHIETKSTLPQERGMLTLKLNSHGINLLHENLWVIRHHVSIHHRAKGNMIACGLYILIH